MPTSMFTVQAASTTLQGTSGAPRTATFQVSNLTDQPQRIQLQAVPSDPAASFTTTVDPPQLTLEARGSGTVAVAVDAGLSATESALRFRVRAYSANLAPEETEAWSQTVEVAFAAPEPAVIRRRRFPWWIPVAAVAALAVVAGIVVVSTRDDETVAIPILRDGSVLEAILALDDAGLEATAQSALTDIAARPVASSDPAEGTRVKKGTIVTLIVDELVTVPDLAGLRVENARQVLTDLGLRLRVRVDTGRDGGVRVFDLVVATNPRAGTNVALGSTVAIVARPSRTFPRFTTLADAQALATVARLTIVVENGPDEPGACVVQQQPSAGSPIQPAGTVVLRTAGAPARLGGRICALLGRIDVERLTRR